METNVGIPIKRSDFGDGFIFGASSSAYQIEGAVADGGRKDGIWDTFIRNRPYFILDGSNAKEACDSYNLFKEDVQMLKTMGANAYRFSFSWPRILPGGKLSAGINREGIKYYNDLIDELVANDIKPVVTLFHWDVPQALDDEYQGFLGRQIVDDFADFAELCFWEFGDRVKHWITINEPTTFSVGGYCTGVFAPGRGLYSPDAMMPSRDSAFEHRKGAVDVPVLPRSSGKPAEEPYWVAHHLLLAHAEAVHIYRHKFKYQKGQIGLSLVTEWCEPLNNTSADREAVERQLDFTLGWFMLPVFKGRYPDRMHQRVGSRLPPFSDEEIAKLIGSYDFLGLNYYTGQYAADDSSSSQPASYLKDRAVKLQNKAADGKTDIGPVLGTSTMCCYPEGLYHLLLRIKSEYGNPLIYITENGYDQKSSKTATVSEVRDDPERITYIKGHLESIKKAKSLLPNRANVQGYFVWSLTDDFEWMYGLSKRFGLSYVNYADGSFSRYPKSSALWYANFLHEDENKLMDIPQAKQLPAKRPLDIPDHETQKKKPVRRLP